MTSRRRISSRTDVGTRVLQTRAVILCVVLPLQGCNPTNKRAESTVQSGLTPTTGVLAPTSDGFASTPEPVVACDEAQWTSHSSSAKAFAHVLSSKPRVVAIGETHARRGTASVLTATERFAELLPLAKGQGASVLVVELLSPPAGCETETKAVAAAQKPVVEQQDEQNQDRFVALGHRARELQMTPLVLEPTCEEFARVRQAGADGVAAMLELIAQHTAAKLERLLSKVPANETILAYGGALHNNLGQDAPFAFGERLKTTTNGNYVAVDLIVPEYVADTDAWKKLPWYPCWPQLKNKGVTLLQHAPNDFTLFMETGLVRKEAPNASVEAAQPSGSGRRAQ